MRGSDSGLTARARSRIVLPLLQAPVRSVARCASPVSGNRCNDRYAVRRAQYRAR
jgi:hypothetical protein